MDGTDGAGALDGEVSETMDEAKSALLRRLFESIDDSDWGTLSDLLHPEVVYERPGYDPLVGLERVLRFYREERLVASGSHRIEGVVVDGDAASAWGRMRGTLRDGSSADVRWAEVYSFEDGRIRTRRSYFFQPAV